MGLFDFKIRDGVLLKYAGKAANVIVPDKVRIIGEEAFKGNGWIRSVVLPEGIREIRREAFFMAQNLEKINFPSSLDTIWSAAFQGCSSLKDIRLPESLRSIGNDCFAYCRGLTEVEIPSGVREIYGGAFYKCTSLTRIRIPEGVKFHALVFSGCTAIEHFDIPETYLFDRSAFTGVFGLDVPMPERTEKKDAGASGTEQKDTGSFLLRHRTRADLPLTDKKYIFLHYASKDRAEAQKLADTILAFDSGAEYAVWFTDNAEAVFREKNFAELGQMAVFIPVITDNYLQMAEQFGTDGTGRCRFSMEAFNRDVVIVLPVFLNPGSEEGFNRLFGDLHGIELANMKLQMQLETHLESILGGSGLQTSIRDRAFSRDLFLSYRKKDREQALKVMKRIHDTPEGRGAAIWFDDFLVPGEDFREQISDMLRQADAMILSVTPNVLEEGNYVKVTEYPDAREKMKKTVIPVEVVATDSGQLQKDFPGLDSCIPADDTEALNNKLRTISGKQTGKTYGPLELYLLGMAFLTGFRVEKDTKRGIGLLEAAAAGSEEHACRHLGFLYLSGRGVDRDLSKTIRWYEQAYKIYKDKKNIEEIQDLLYGMDGLILLLRAQNEIPRSVEMSREFLTLLRENPETDAKNVETRKLWEARALVEVSDTHFDSQMTEKRWNQAREDAKKAMEILSSYSGGEEDEAAALRGSAEFHLGGLYLSAGDTERGMPHVHNAASVLEKVTERNPLQEYRKIYAGILGTLGLLQRQEAIQKSMRDPFHSIQLMQPAQMTLGKAVVTERALAAESPTINNREGLAIALFNLSLVDVEKDDARDHLIEARDIVQKLQEETRDGSFNDFEQEIRTLMKKKRVKDR